MSMKERIVVPSTITGVIAELAEACQRDIGALDEIFGLAGITREAVTLSACRLFVASSKCSSGETRSAICSLVAVKSGMVLEHALALTMNIS